MQSFIKNLDFLSPKVELYLNGKTRFKSIFGGIFSLFLVIIGLIGFIYLSLKVFQHTELTVSLNTFFANESIYVLNTSETIIAMKLSTSTVEDFDDNTYTAKAQFIEYNFEEDSSGVKIPKVNRIKLNFTKCGKNFKLNSTEFNNLYSTVELSQFYCLDPGQIIKIKNPFGVYYYFSYINFFFTHCTHRKDCKNSTIIDKELSTYHFHFFSTDYYVNNDDYNVPLQPFAKLFSELSTSSFYKRIYYYLKNVNHISDNGIILPDKKTTSKTCFYDQKSSIDFRNTNFDGGKVLLQFTYGFNEGGFHDRYFRNYKKIQNVLAEIGGFIESLKICCSIIIITYVEVISIPHILKDFNLLQLQDLDNNMSNKKENTLDLINHKPDKLFQNYFNNKQKIKFKFEKLPSEKEIISKCLCIRRRGSKHSHSIYFNAKLKLIKYYFEITNLIKLKNELNFLNSFLFTEEKLNYLSFYATNIINLAEPNTNKNNGKHDLDPNERFEINLNQISDVNDDQIEIFKRYLKS